MKSKELVLAFTLGVIFLAGGTLLTAASQGGISPVSVPPARYQIIINPSVPADTFLLDTQTGRIWKQVQYIDLEGKPRVWKPEDRVDSETELIEWGKRFRHVESEAGHP